METSLYELHYKDGRVYKIFCANRKQNKDMLRILFKEQKKLKRNGQIVVRSGIHTMPEFKKIMQIEL